MTHLPYRGRFEASGEHVGSYGSGDSSSEERGP
jgi:hypothetical protein